MALPQATDTWQNVTLTSDEVWFAESAPFVVHCFGGAAPTGNDGATIFVGDSIRFASGQTVYYKANKGTEAENVPFARVEVS